VLRLIGSVLLDLVYVDMQDFQHSGKYSLMEQNH